MKNMGDLGDVQIDDSDNQKPSNPPLETQSSFADFGLAADNEVGAAGADEEEKKDDDTAEMLGEFRRTFVANIKSLIEFKDQAGE